MISVVEISGQVGSMSPRRVHSARMHTRTRHARSPLGPHSTRSPSVVGSRSEMEWYTFTDEPSQDNKTTVGSHRNISQKSEPDKWDISEMETELSSFNSLIKLNKAVIQEHTNFSICTAEASTVPHDRTLIISNRYISVWQWLFVKSCRWFGKPKFTKYGMKGIKDIEYYYIGNSINNIIN